MGAARTVKALASFAIIAATKLLGGAQAMCLVIGDNVDIDAGCATSTDEGVCNFGLVSGDLVCLTGAGVGQVCGDGCTCARGVCVSPPFLPCGEWKGTCQTVVLAITPARVMSWVVAIDAPEYFPPNEPPGTGGDPHMIGLKGQKIDWKGEDGGWYALLSCEENEVQISLRLTAPLPVEFPGRQLITGFALKDTDGHSLVIETKNPYTTMTDGCPHGVNLPCLSDGALKITVDGEHREAVPLDNVILNGGTVITATNLPTECQPFGGDIIWATKFAENAAERHLSNKEEVDDWVLGWATTTAAPSWCAKCIGESGVQGLFDYRSKHAVFKIETPSLNVRLHHGTNHQGGETLDDGRILPDLEFWQMDVHFEWLGLNPDTVTGILGETMRPVLDSAGDPIMSGSEALRGKVEDFRMSGPLEFDFDGVNE